MHSKPLPVVDLVEDCAGLRVKPSIHAAAEELASLVLPFLAPQLTDRPMPASRESAITFRGLTPPPAKS